MKVESNQETKTTEPRYVLGFLFSPSMYRVALIRKARPQSQAGLLNGMGGAINDGETPESAMRREFLEEAGLDVSESDWHRFGTMTGRAGYDIALFVARGTFEAVKSQTDEEVVIRDYDVVQTCAFFQGTLLHNLPWLLAMARGHLLGDKTVYNIGQAFND